MVWQFTNKPEIFSCVVNDFGEYSRRNLIVSVQNFYYHRYFTKMGSCISQRQVLLTYNDHIMEDDTKFTQGGFRVYNFYMKCYVFTTVHPGLFSTGPVLPSCEYLPDYS